MDATETALADLHQRYAESYGREGRYPRAEYVPEWDCPCYRGEPDGAEIGWQAVPQQPPLDFTATEKALELSFHPAVRAFFSGFYAGDLAVRFRGRKLTLLQVMHPEDGQRLLQNLVGHVLMKRRLEQPATLFIGVGAEDDAMLTVHNEHGAVGLELAGQNQQEILASDLADFLQRVEPLT